MDFPDDNHLLSCGDDGTVRLWDLHAAKELHEGKFNGHQGPVLDLAVWSEGRIAVSGGKDKTVILWKLPKGAGFGLE